MSCRADPGTSVALTKYQCGQEEPDPHCNNLFLISSWPLDDPYSSLTSVTVLSTYHGSKISWSNTQRHANQWCTRTSAFTGQEKKKKRVWDHTRKWVWLYHSAVCTVTAGTDLLSAHSSCHTCHARPTPLTHFKSTLTSHFIAVTAFSDVYLDSSSAMF